MRLSKTIALVAVAWLASTSSGAAQDFRGRINGTVTDNSGAVLPGVTVTATSPALIQPQVQVSGAEGDFRFLALPPGVYDISFELSGFQSVKREGIRVVINQTLTVDQQLQVATLQETVTVTGESPIVDTSTTTMGTNFTKELLTEIPNARDVWAAMSQAPGLQMTQYDVGGSRTGNQSGYRTYGFDTQNQTRLEGIDTTEGTAANAGYFDFGSFEEFSIGGAGADASAFAGGAVLSISVKSGGDRVSGSWYSDWEGDATIGDNVPDNLRVSNQPDEDGYFVRNALTRGNPIDRQYDLNFNVGGPLVKGKVWWFYSYRLNDQYKTILGFEELARSKLTNPYTFKGTFQLNRNNQVIGFLNKREKLQDKRDIGPNTPLSAALYQSSRNYPWKWEWTSVLGSRAFLDVLAGNWYNFFPLRPTRDFDLYDGPWGPGRQDVATTVFADGGANNGYQDQKRYKPQFYASIAYFKDGWAGSHDFKAGYDWKRDRRNLFEDQPFDLFYRDTSAGLPAGSTPVISQVDLYNSPTSPINDVVYNAAWINDTWKINNRLTLTLGGRLEHYRDGWPEQQFAPNGHPMLANWNDPVYRAFVSPRTVEARTVAEDTSFVPRAGFAYDLTGDNRTVLKGYFGQSKWNSADTLADLENPVARAQLRYAFVPCTATRTTRCDLNGNRLLDGPEELGDLNSTQGGGGFVRIDRDIKRPSSNELSVSLEREIVQSLSGRASYVYKNMRNVWGETDAVRAPAYTIPYTLADPGPDNVLGTGDEQTFQTFDRPPSTQIGSDRLFTNPGGMDADFHTIEVAVNRRFTDKWMLLTSFGYTWSSMLHETTGYQRMLGHALAGSTQPPVYLPARRLFGDNGIETSTLWNYKAIGRYVLPLDIGLSGSWRVQSGQNYGRTVSVNFPGDGTRTIRVEPIDTNRFPNISILDFRLDKSFRFGRAGKLTGMIDVFNLMNNGTPTTIRTTTVTYREVTALLDPRIVRFGVRYDF
jgi:hypothetical protein